MRGRSDKSCKHNGVRGAAKGAAKGAARGFVEAVNVYLRLQYMAHFWIFSQAQVGEAGDIGIEIDQISHHSSLILPTYSARALFSFYLHWKSVLTLVGQRPCNSGSDAFYKQSHGIARH
jgi:hypothetical protein